MILIGYNFSCPVPPAWHDRFNIIGQRSENKPVARRNIKMKKSLSMLALTVFVVLITGTFSYAEYAAAGADNFPYFHLGAMVIGGLTILSLKQKYEKLYVSEAAGSFALYAVLIALFTSPVADAIKNMIG